MEGYRNSTACFQVPNHFFLAHVLLTARVTARLYMCPVLVLVLVLEGIVLFVSIMHTMNRPVRWNSQGDQRHEDIRKLVRSFFGGAWAEIPSEDVIITPIGESGELQMRCRTSFLSFSTQSVHESVAGKMCPKSFYMKIREESDVRFSLCESWM